MIIWEIENEDWFLNKSSLLILLPHLPEGLCCEYPLSQFLCWQPRFSEMWTPCTPTPSPYIPMNVMSGLPLGGRAGLGPLSHCVYNSWWYCHPLRMRLQGFSFLSVSSLLRLFAWWVSCVMGAWLPPSIGPLTLLVCTASPHVLVISCL